MLHTTHTTDLDASLLFDPETFQEIIIEYLRKAVTIFSKISKEGSKNTKANDYELEESILSVTWLQHCPTLNGSGV
jgi:hypothetical protein